jgi:Na+-driven multidrug efflux pump
MVLLVLIALGTAVTPFVGQNYGAGRMDRVANGIRWCQRFSVAYGLSVAVLLAIAAPHVAGLFTDDATAISTALMHMRIVPASYLAIGFALAASNSFNAIGKPMAGMVISLTRTILVYAPLAWLLSGTLGLVGIFAAACTANVMAGAVGLLWCRAIFARLK